MSNSSGLRLLVVVVVFKQKRENLFLVFTSSSLLVLLELLLVVVLKLERSNTDRKLPIKVVAFFVVDLTTRRMVHTLNSMNEWLNLDVRQQQRDFMLCAATLLSCLTYKTTTYRLLSRFGCQRCATFSASR